MVGQHEQTNGKIVDSKLKEAQGTRISCKDIHEQINNSTGCKQLLHSTYFCNHYTSCEKDGDEPAYHL
jgi:hypothetical protein